MIIAADSRALVHFNVLLTDGSAADSTRVEGKPVWFVLGNTLRLRLHESIKFKHSYCLLLIDDRPTSRISRAKSIFSCYKC